MYGSNAKFMIFVLNMRLGSKATKKKNELNPPKHIKRTHQQNESTLKTNLQQKTNLSI